MKRHYLFIKIGGKISEMELQTWGRFAAASKRYEVSAHRDAVE